MQFERRADTTANAARYWLTYLSIRDDYYDRHNRQNLLNRYRLLHRSEKLSRWGPDKLLHRLTACVEAGQFW